MTNVTNNIRLFPANIKRVYKLRRLINENLKIKIACRITCKNQLFENLMTLMKTNVARLLANIYI